MKTVCKKLLCLMLVAMLLVSAVPAAFAAAGDPCKITLSPYAGSQDLSANKVSVYFEEGATITAAEVKNLANQAWASLGYEYVSCLLGDDGTIAMPGTTIPVEVRVNQPAACEHDDTTTTNTATCGAAGTKTVVCNDCGKTVSTTDVAATGAHNYANGACTVCGAAEPNNNQPAQPAEPGDLIIHIMTRYETDGYKDAGTVVLSGEDSYKLNKALAERVVGKQLLDYKWQPISGTVDMTDGDVEVNLLATILETPNNKNVYKLRVMFNRGNGNDDYKQIDIYEGEGILAAIKSAGIAPKYEDHVLVGYLNNHTGTAASYLSIYDVASAAIANEQGVIKVFADWREETDDDDEDFEYGEGGGLYGDENEDPIYDVVLYIYTNGKTSSYAKKVTSSDMGKHTKDGKLTRDEVQLVVENYFKTYDDTKYYGLFTKYYWNDGNYLTKNAVSSIELDADETNYVYVMVKDAKAYVADSSNPKTGDSIMIAVSTMALAAVAMVSMVELKKRKMI